MIWPTLVPFYQMAPFSEMAWHFMKRLKHYAISKNWIKYWIKRSYRSLVSTFWFIEPVSGPFHVYYTKFQNFCNLEVWLTHTLVYFIGNLYTRCLWHNSSRKIRKQLLTTSKCPNRWWKFKYFKYTHPILPTTGISKKYSNKLFCTKTTTSKCWSWCTNFTLW